MKPTKRRRSHLVHLLLKGLSIGTVSVLTHPITYPISASALLCQANVVRSAHVRRIIFYAFSKARYINLFQGGGLATITKTFINLASVAVEDIWLAISSPLSINRDTSLLISKLVGILFNIAVNGPLDVIRTRLALQEFGSKPTGPQSIVQEYNKILAEEGRSSLYAGWQVVVLQYILDYGFQKLDKNAQKKKEGSIVQLLPMIAKFLIDYAFTVIKIRANMRNTGIFRILRSIFSQKGLRGFMAGWKLHLLLFPTVMVNMILANVLFLHLKKLVLPKKNIGASSNNNNGNIRDEDRGNGGEGPSSGNNDELRRSEEIQKINWTRVNSSFFS